MKAIKNSILLLICLISFNAVSQVDFSRGERLIEKKSYATAADFFNQYRNRYTYADIMYARCQYWQKEMSKCNAAYQLVAKDSLKELDKFYWADALWQLGKKEDCKRIGQELNNEIFKNIIAGYGVKSDTSLVYTPEKTKVVAMHLAEHGSAFSSYWYKGQLYFVSNSKEVSLIDDVADLDSTTFLDIKVNGDSSQLPLNKMNTFRHDANFIVSPTDDRIILTRNKNVKPFSSIERPQLYEMKLKNGKWSRAKRLPFCDYNAVFAHPAMSKDGKKLYFTSSQSGGPGGLDLYAVSVDGDTWGEPELLTNKINTGRDEAFPTVSGDYLFFSSNGKEGMGGMDLYAWHIPSNEVIHLPEPLNSNRDDFSLHNNGTDSIWFASSNRNAGVNQDDVLKFTYAKVQPKMYVYDEETSKLIRNLEGKSKVTGSREFQLSGTDNKGVVPPYLADRDSVFLHGYYPHQLNFDKQTGVVWFLRKHSKNKLKPIHQVELGIEIPKEIAQIEGFKRVEIYNGPVSMKQVFTITGESNVAQQLPYEGLIEGDTLTIQVYKDSVLVGVAKQVVTANQVMRGKKVGVKEDLWKGDVLNKPIPVKQDAIALELKNIYFATDKWLLSSSAKKELARVVKVMQENPSLVIECGAHADCRATREYNQKLSERRAKATAEYIVKQGVTKDRVLWKGYGEDKPVNDCVCEGEVKTTCDTPQLQLNRRTEFKIIKR